MSETEKVEVKVSAEVNTILRDLFNQIQYEFCEQYEKEIERLNNIINELEEDIENALKEARVNNYHMGEWNNNNRGRYDAYLYVYDKLQELKGSDKE